MKWDVKQKYEYFIQVISVCIYKFICIGKWKHVTGSTSNVYCGFCV